MAEVTAFRNNALPYPVYGAPWVLTFPILDNTGALVTAAADLDSEISKNGDTAADCTNEATEIATSTGMYYLILTGAEMTADIVTGIVKTSTADAKTTPFALYPRKLVPLRSNTAQGGAAGYITLDASAGAVNDMWNGCLCVATIDSNVEARIIDDYNGSNQQASVTPDWNVTPDSDDTFVIYLPEGVQIPNGEVMRGTDSAALASVCTETRLAELDAANLPTDVAAIPTTPMRGTDNAALAATALTDATWTDAKAAFLDAAISSRNSVTPDAAGTAATLHGITDGKIDGLNDFDGTGATLHSDYDAAKTAAQPSDITTAHATTDGLVNGLTDVTAEQVVTAMETDGSKLDHLWEMTEDDGGTRRLTANALEQAPDSDTTTGLTLSGDYDAAKTAAQAGDAMTLTGDYDAAKTAAQPSDITTAHSITDGKIDTNKTELDGLQGADGKALISTDAQDLSATLHVDAKLLEAGDAGDVVKANCQLAIIAQGVATATQVASAHTTTNGYITTVDAVADAIKAKTDGLNFTGSDVKATLDGEEVVTDAASRTASKATGFSTHSAADVTGGTTVAAAVTAISGADGDDLKDISDEIAALSAGGDATAANQTTIITHLTDIKGTGFVKDTHSLTDITPSTPVNLQIAGTDLVIEDA